MILSKNRILIVDYGMGNIHSVVKKITKLNADVIVGNKIEDFSNADKIILPGVGHFGQAMENLKQLQIIDVLHEEVIVKKKPILGICLGMQLMTKFSEEGNVGGLNWFEADVCRFNMKDKLRFKIPHTGWNQILKQKENKILTGLNDGDEFYFLHSYFVKPLNHDIVLTTTSYEQEFVSSIHRDNIWGVQFHPEKSHSKGDRLLSNFITLTHV